MLGGERRTGSVLEGRDRENGCSNLQVEDRTHITKNLLKRARGGEGYVGGTC